MLPSPVAESAPQSIVRPERSKLVEYAVAEREIERHVRSRLESLTLESVMFGAYFKANFRVTM